MGREWVRILGDGKHDTQTRRTPGWSLRYAMDQCHPDTLNLKIILKIKRHFESEYLNRTRPVGRQGCPETLRVWCLGPTHGAVAPIGTNPQPGVPRLGAGTPRSLLEPTVRTCP